MIYLNVEHIVKINVRSIMEHAPEEQVGIKDANALDMAVKQPLQDVFGQELYPDIYSKAGILFINLVKKHPFYNGNKRTAWTAMDVFFRVNGYDTFFPDEVAIEFVLAVVNFVGDFEDLKKWIFNYLRTSSYLRKK